MKIEKGQRVRVQVKLQVVGGEELEKSVVEYYHGSGTMLLGLEKALQGLEKGAKKKGVIKAKEAFGDPAKQIKKTMSRKEFPAGVDLKAGAQFAAKGADNKQDVVLRIDKVEKDTVEATLLHPLADKDIEFEVEVLAVSSPATPPPLPPDALGARESE